jgi:hypothetical protein
MRYEIASLSQKHTGAFYYFKSERSEANLLSVALDKTCTQESFEFLDAARQGRLRHKTRLSRLCEIERL